MWKYLVLIGLFVIVLAACSPATKPEIPSPEEKDEPTAEAPPLATVEPPEKSAEAEMLAPILASATISETAQAADVQKKVPEQEEPVVTGGVEPVTVDLSEITPGPNSGGGEPVEMPAPGAPNPEVKMVHQASQDLAARLGLDIGQVTLIEVEVVMWPDAGLGCPDPDMGYAAVLTPGYKMLISAGGEPYTYHTDQTENLVLCVGGLPAEPIEK